MVGQRWRVEVGCFKATPHSETRRSQCAIYADRAGGRAPQMFALTARPRIREDGYSPGRRLAVRALSGRSGRGPLWTGLDRWGMAPIGAAKKSGATDRGVGRAASASPAPRVPRSAGSINSCCLTTHKGQQRCQSIPGENQATGCSGISQLQAAQVEPGRGLRRSMTSRPPNGGPRSAALRENRENRDTPCRRNIPGNQRPFDVTDKPRGRVARSVQREHTYCTNHQGLRAGVESRETSQGVDQPPLFRVS